MTGEDTRERGIDNERSADSGLALDRRTAMKTGAVGLAALTGFASSAAAKPKHKDGGGSGSNGANQFRFAGQTWNEMHASTDDGKRVSDIETLLQVNEVKKSNSWQDSLVLQPSIESSLITDISLDGDYDRSQAAAGVLGWVEIRESGGGPDDWQMITVDDDLVDPPQQSEVDAEGNLVGDAERKWNLARGVIGYNTRDFRAEWDLTEITQAIEELQQAVTETTDGEYTFDSDWDELFLDMYIQTRSANSFNLTKTNIPGTHDIRLQGALHCFVDDDSGNYDSVQAKAIVGNRQLLVEPRKIKAAQD